MSRARWMGATALGAFAAATYLGTTWGSTGGTAPAAAQRRARARAVVHDEPRDHDAGSERGRMAVARADGTAPSRLVHVPLGRPAALPANAPSANEILPEFQGLQVGDHVPDGTPETRGAGVAAHPGRDRARLAGARLPRRAVDRLRDGSEPPAWSSRARNDGGPASGRRWRSRRGGGPPIKNSGGTRAATNRPRPGPRRAPRRRPSRRRRLTRAARARRAVPASRSRSRRVGAR